MKLNKSKANSTGVDKLESNTSVVVMVVVIE